jgi:HD superfamily phosphohydrolase
MIEAVSQNRPVYDFSHPVDLRDIAGADILLRELVATPAFQRLKSIRFLGGIDYLLVRSPNGARGNVRHTRYQHSLGVARLALRYSDLRELSFSERRIVFVAALLHDVGHAPLSHSLEPVFKECFGLEHHRATEDILRGRAPLGSEIPDLLGRNGVDIDRVIAIISGEEANYDSLFSGPINFDTIEGILRTLRYAGRNVGTVNPEAVVEAAVRRANQADCCASFSCVNISTS